MVDAVQQYVAKTTYASGVPSTLSTNTSGVAAAAALAAAADAVVLVLGTDLSSAHEEMDAHNITIPSGQLALLRACARSAKKPLTVVMMTAVPLDLTQLLCMPEVGAVLHTGQPSVQTLGIGDVIFGAKPPAGRLIQTIYPKEYADEVAIFDFNMRPGPSAFPRPDCAKAKGEGCPLGTNPGRTYRFYTGQAVLPFGFGTRARPPSCALLLLLPPSPPSPPRSAPCLRPRASAPPRPPPPFAVASAEGQGLTTARAQVCRTRASLTRSPPHRARYRSARCRACWARRAMASCALPTRPRPARPPQNPSFLFFCASVCAAPTLNAAGPSRATLSLRQEQLRAAL